MNDGRKKHLPVKDIEVPQKSGINKCPYRPNIYMQADDKNYIKCSTYCIDNF